MNSRANKEETHLSGRWRLLALQVDTVQRLSEVIHAWRWLTERSLLLLLWGMTYRRRLAVRWMLLVRVQVVDGRRELLLLLLLRVTQSRVERVLLAVA